MTPIQDHLRFTTALYTVQTINNLSVEQGSVRFGSSAVGLNDADHLVPEISQ